jgi:hypothetical protein
MAALTMSSSIMRLSSQVIIHAECVTETGSQQGFSHIIIVKGACTLSLQAIARRAAGHYSCAGVDPWQGYQQCALVTRRPPSCAYDLQRTEAGGRTVWLRSRSGSPGSRSIFRLSRGSSGLPPSAAVIASLLVIE